MNNVDQSQLPPRLREKAFRKYEPTIMAIVRDWPIPVKVLYGGESANTVAARLRDAILSFKRYRWVSLINSIEFDDIADKIKVAHRGQFVYAGDMKEIDRICGEMVPIVAESIQAQTTTPPSEKMQFTVKEVQVICKLVSAKLVSRPITVVGIDDENVEYLEDNFDVRIDKQEDGSYVIS